MSDKGNIATRDGHNPDSVSDITQSRTRAHTLGAFDVRRYGRGARRAVTEERDGAGIGSGCVTRLLSPSET